MKNVFNVVFFLFLPLVSCMSQDKWEGGAISKPGVYEKDGLKIIVNKEGYSIDYLMLDSVGDTLVRSNRRFSSAHRWALHLDKDKNLWVFSADIGSFLWKKDSVSKMYIEQVFTSSLSKDSVPADVWSTLKQFPYYTKE